MRKTKIVATIGPASEEKDMLKRLISAGMNVARLNFSHGSHEEHRSRIKTIREAAAELETTVSILLDTKGPEIRTYTMENDAITLEKGQPLIVTGEEVVGTTDRIGVTYQNLSEDLSVGNTILLDDGLIGLHVDRIEGKDVVTTVMNNGVLKNKKGVNLPKVKVNLPGMTDKDAADIRFGIEEEVDFIAASFVRRASDVLEIRELLEAHGAGDTYIIPKIENEEGVENIAEILEVSDGLMVARGDLGVEIPPEEVPLVQKKLIQRCNDLAKPVITATQMLDSMQRNPRPTRAEASDVANAIFDGTDAIMLSGETAAGDYPFEAVETMSNIAKRAESALDFDRLLNIRTEESQTTITNSISQAVARTALTLNTPAILTATESGYTARLVSKYRPKATIVAVTSNIRAQRRLTLVWGVHPLLGNTVETTDEMFDETVSAALKSNQVKHGDLVVITAGVPVGEIGTTNMMKVHVIGEVAAKGQGIGRTTASGKAVVVKDAAEANARMEEGNILITTGTDKEMMPAFEKAAAVITEEGGLTCHAAVVGISLSVPVIVGVHDAVKIFKDGEELTVDSSRGDIYKGHARVL
ncbi:MULTISPECIES: pyruvate kinase [unclassified Geomicrobium]|uniref:pyruvate kinase n=1 Tax=unclassified Geomicrobium TaxID=2628951 RepID=UPI00045ED32B|nr:MULTISPECIES: pyruvate kinase [unclassified Geomicrobium]GAJ99370.1 pyruvate kinase [Geomicrobium sp. JCM 19055]GAK09695.1 pyruvate kinase [Geomicrobium sp. JCM 19038]